MQIKMTMIIGNYAFLTYHDVVVPKNILVSEGWVFQNIKKSEVNIVEAAVR